MCNPTTTTEPSGNRKDTLPIKVFCNPAERKLIIAKAGQCGLSASNFLRNVGLGIGIVSAIDHQKIDELLRINGDLGRLGGLLKLWLQTKDLSIWATRTVCQSQIQETLTLVRANQALIEAAIKQVVKQ